MRGGYCLAALMLILILGLGGAGCAGQLEETSGTVQTISASLPGESDTEPAETPDIPELPLVSDAYFNDSFASVDYPVFTHRMYYHIPRVNLELPQIEEVNDQIYTELYHGLLEESVVECPDFPSLAQLAYSYGVKDETLSILVCAYEKFTAESWDERQYYVYNLSMETGDFLSDEALLSAFGMTREEYREALEAAAEERCRELYEQNSAGIQEESYYQKALTWTRENLDGARPYIDAGGDLCAAMIIGTVDGDGAEGFALNLTGTGEPMDPSAFGDVTQPNHYE